MPKIAKFTYTIKLSTANDSGATGLTYAQQNEPGVRDAIFAQQKQAYNQAIAQLGYNNFTLEAYSYSDAELVATKQIAKALNCELNDVRNTHRISVYAQFISDARSRRILRRRSLSQRRSDSDRYGIAYAYLEAKWWRTDFDTHYMNIADMLDEPTRSEFLDCYDY
jgi:hypothetical protein